MTYRFQCVGPSCDRCCVGTEHGGFVQITAADALNLGRDLAKITLTRVLRDADGELRQDLRGELAMYQKPGKRCVFWAEGEGCSVHARKPAQCTKYPFWESVVRSWEQEKERCPGIGVGPKLKLHKIRRAA